MKKLFLLMAIIFLGAGLSFGQTKMAASFPKLKWLTGNWKLTGLKPGQSGNETWEQVSAIRFNGKSFTLKGIDTLEVEKLSLICKDENIFYVADVAHNPKPVYFILTDITDHSFTCENPDHDFPKKITYVLTDGKIKATISGNGKSIDYYFEKNP